MTQIETIFRTYFDNNRTDDRDLDLLHATDAVRNFIYDETEHKRVALPHWCNLAKLDQVYGNKGVFERFCRELQEDLDAAKAKVAAMKENPALNEIESLKEQLAEAQELAEARGEIIARERSRADSLAEINKELTAQLKDVETGRLSDHPVLGITLVFQLVDALKAYRTKTTGYLSNKVFHLIDDLSGSAKDKSIKYVLNALYEIDGFFATSQYKDESDEAYADRRAIAERVDLKTILWNVCTTL